MRCTDWPVCGENLFEVRQSDLTRLGANGAADQIVRDRGEDQFLTKNTDRQQEAEFRLLVMSDSADVFLDISQALRAVVLADQVDQREYSKIQAQLNDRGIQAHLAVLRWMNGFPTVLPAILT